MNNKKVSTLLFVFLSCCLFINCKQEKSKDTHKDKANFKVMSLLDAAETGINFKNTSIETLKRHLGFYDYFYNGGGVAIVDINNDGLQDIYFAGNDAFNKLYVNKGGFKFEDISDKANIKSGRWSTGVTQVDINNDGYLDIYVCNSGPTEEDALLANQLFVNNGDETFTEMAAQYGIDDNSYSSQAVFFDLDNDGDLDLFVLNHSWANYGVTLEKWINALAEKSPEIAKKSYSSLYRNEGNGTFTDITDSSGISKPGFGLGVSVSDFDKNGYLDIFVTNDYFVPDYLFLNRGNEIFKEAIKKSAMHTSFYSMGCDAADFNNDGLIDIAVVDMTPADHFRNKTLMASMNTSNFNHYTKDRKFIPQYMYNTLQLNRGAGSFSEIAQLSGIAQTDWSWSVLLFDLDNDMQKDIYVTNGFKRDTKDNDWKMELMKRNKEQGNTAEVFFKHLDNAKSVPISNHIFKNLGSLTFKNKTSEWGMEEPSFSNGAAYGDLDNDGDLDLVVNNLESNAFVYRNNTSEKDNTHFLQIELVDNKSSKTILNSIVKVHTGDIVQTLEYSFVRGYLSSMQPMAHFGLGDNKVVDKVEIFWPDKSVLILENLKADKKYTINKEQSSFLNAEVNKVIPYFTNIARQAKDLTYKHTENNFDDFNREVLLPHRQSTLGPALSVGDINKDGLEDFYIGGALGQPGEIYIQSVTGFVPSLQAVFNKDSKYEDTGALFFDADGDGDVDLYVASGGGGEVAKNERLLQDRLYLNDGQGAFTRSTNGLPEITSSTLHISTNDWDGDGDLDLFVAGRTTPGKYPVAPQSYLLENKNGIFADKTEQLAPGIKYAGMVTSSVWSDINNDGKKDLMIVGEWMGIKAFVNTNTGFEDKSETFGLTNTTGWWYSIATGDFDKDGDEDFIVGNVGLNNKFHPTEKKPLHIFSNDFDANGTLDIVLSKLYKGNLTPVRGKECSTEQMPFLKEKFASYSGFASSTLVEIYGQEKLNEALHYEATNFASVYLENTGDGKFNISNLPLEAQLSPLNDMVVYDFDKDGNLDVVLGGNMYNTEVETPAYDAGKGLYLQGRGDGTFTSIFEVHKSGIYMPYNVKGLKLIKISKQKLPAILVANNNNPVQLFAWIR